MSHFMNQIRHKKKIEEKDNILENEPKENLTQEEEIGNYEETSKEQLDKDLPRS